MFLLQSPTLQSSPRFLKQLAAKTFLLSRWSHWWQKTLHRDSEAVHSLIFNSLARWSLMSEIQCGNWLWLRVSETGGLSEGQMLTCLFRKLIHPLGLDRLRLELTSATRQLAEIQPTGCQLDRNQCKGKDKTTDSVERLKPTFFFFPNAYWDSTLYNFAKKHLQAADLLVYLTGWKDSILR